MEKRKFNFSGVFALITAVLLLAVLVPINIIFNYFDKNIDMTSESQYTFTDTTLKLLEDTSDKQIEIYFLYDMKELERTPDFLALYHNLQQLSEYDNIKVYDYMLDENPDIEKLLNPTGTLTLGDADVIVKCGDLIKQVPSNRIFLYDSNDIMTYAGEENIASAINIVTSGSLPTVYFLTGHEEKTIDDGYSNFAKMLKADNYDVKSINLDEEEAVPDNAVIVMLAAPQCDITDGEKEKLLDYAEKGGAMAFLIPPLDVEGRLSNIEEVLEKFELGLDYNYVTEGAAERMLNNRDYEQDEHFFSVLYPEATEDFTVDFVSEINDLVENNALVAGISNARSLYQILGTNNNYIEKSRIITNNYGDNGYTTISTPYGGDEETAQAAEELNGELIELEFGFYSYNKSNGAKMVALGTSDIIDSDTISASVSTTQQLFLNSITWMYNPDVSLDIGEKVSDYAYLTFSGAEEAESVMNYFFIFPAVIALVGLAVWLKRRHS